MKKILFNLTLVYTSIFTPLFVQASSQGTLGSESQGSSDLTIQVPLKFNISGMEDINFGSVSYPYSDLSMAQNFCVYTNSVNGQYSISIQGNNNGDGTNFYLTGSNNNTQTIAYQVYFNNNPTPGNITIENGQMLSNQTGANNSNLNCATNSMTSNLQITIPAKNLEKASAQSYTDTITITIQQ